MKIEVSNGEIIDKLSILEIKASRISSSEKLRNIKKELDALLELASTLLPICQQEYITLKEINENLWKIEDRIRELEHQGNFGEEFIQTARKVYLQNDKRAAIKKKINDITGSDLSEEKSYQEY